MFHLQHQKLKALNFRLISQTLAHEKANVYAKGDDKSSELRKITQLKTNKKLWLQKNIFKVNCFKK